MRSIARVVAPLVTIAAVSIGGAAPSAQHSELDPQIVKLVGSVSEERLGVILKKLESFETRNTLSSTTSATRGIGAARQWILDEMQSYSPKLQVSFDTYQVAKQGRITRDVELRNVMAVLPGRSRGGSTSAATTTRVARAGGQGAIERRHGAAGGQRAARRSRTRPQTTRRPASTTTAAARR